MGTDIHMVIEQWWPSRKRWVGLHTCPHAHIRLFPDARTTEMLAHAKVDLYDLTGSAHWGIRGRDYDLFADLAGVRGDGPPAKGIPDDASDLAILSEVAGSDHSHSHMLLSEMLPILMKHKGGTEMRLKGDTVSSVQMHFLDRLGIDDRYNEEINLDHYRVVFGFDS